VKAIAVNAVSQDKIEPHEEPQPEPKNDVSPDEGGHLARVASPRDGSRLALVIEHLKRADGATIIDLSHVTGRLPHTTRAALTWAAQTRVCRDPRTGRRWRFSLPDLGRPC
jgi:Protein of unknown function (DUF3489)